MEATKAKEAMEAMEAMKAMKAMKETEPMHSLKFAQEGVPEAVSANPAIHLSTRGDLYPADVCFGQWELMTND